MCKSWIAFFFQIKHLSTSFTADVYIYKSIEFYMKFENVSSIWIFFFSLDFKFIKLYYSV